MTADGHVVIRADASSAIGTGHVVRCRTLADALIARGWTASFATRGLPDGLATSLDRAGIGRVALEAAGDDAAVTAAELERAGRDRPTLLVVDHYDIDAAWIDAVRSSATAVLAVDDLVDRPQPVDIVLNQNLGIDADGYAALVPPDCRVLVGPMFALVRGAFADAGEARNARGALPPDGRVERVLVFLSGADPDDVTSRAVAALEGTGLAADIVVGAAYPNLADLRPRVDANPSLRLHIDTDEMADLTASADLAVGAPSSASWERCTLGVPTVLVILADNQLAVERGLVAAGAAISAGWHTGVTVDTIRALLVDLIAEPERVAAMGHRAAEVTDGRGTDRVIAEIEALVRARMEAR